MEYINKIICGDTLSVLKTLPNESVNCIVTSPPYWGLRDYGIEPIIWDGDKDCKHEFDNINRLHPTRGNRGQGVDKKYTIRQSQQPTEINSNFCTKCNTWRGSLGLEPTFKLYIKHLCDIFDEIKRVLRKDGTCWVNMGDTYSAKPTGSLGGIFANRPSKIACMEQMEYRKKNNLDVTLQITAKSLMLIPQRFAIEMVNRGWILRNTIIWHKPNCMPSSTKDRFTVDFEYVYFFVKSKKYWFEQQYEPHLSPITNKIVGRKGTNVQQSRGDPNGYHAYGENCRNKRAVWTIPTKPFPEAHFAVYPEALIEPMLKAGCPKDGIVLDPFMGAGTTAVVAKKLGRKYLGIEIKQEYIDMANKRIKKIPETLF